MEENDVKISQIIFKNFKALRYFSISLHQMNILVGPNNCGKSTIISAFRILDVAIKIARWKSAEFLETPEGRVYGYELSHNVIPVSLENIHTNYAEEITSITFFLTNKNKMILLFPTDGRCIFLAETDNYGRIKTPGKFKTEFPVQIVVVPVMGPVEHEEEEVTLDT